MRQQGLRRRFAALRRDGLYTQIRPRFGADAQNENADERLIYKLRIARFYSRLLTDSAVLSRNKLTQKAECPGETAAQSSFSTLHQTLRRILGERK